MAEILTLINRLFQQLPIDSFKNLNTVIESSVQTLKLILEGLWEQIQNGLTVEDLETYLFFAVFLRFIFVAIRYNIKTSFFVTLIGLVAGSLWFNHFIELLRIYQIFLAKMPSSKLKRFVESLPENWRFDPVKQMSRTSIDINSFPRLSSYTGGTMPLDLDMDLAQEDIDMDWRKPSSPYFPYFAEILSKFSVKKFISTTFYNAVVKTDLQTKTEFYVDPVSLLVSKTMTKLNTTNQNRLMSFYYTIYNEIIPNLFKVWKFIWYQFSGIASYILITRLGKRFCPYLIRWHWTFLLLLTLLERPVTVILYRACFFTYFFLAKQIKITESFYMKQQIKPESLFDTLSILKIKYQMMDHFVIIGITTHLVLIFLGFLHAIFGQYFYVPFLVPNTELQVGLRPVTSLYSQGKTPWQDNDLEEDNELGENSEKSNKFRRLRKLIKEFFKKLRRKLFPPNENEGDDRKNDE